MEKNKEVYKEKVSRIKKKVIIYIKRKIDRSKFINKTIKYVLEELKKIEYYIPFLILIVILFILNRTQGFEQKEILFLFIPFLLSLIVILKQIKMLYLLFFEKEDIKVFSNSRPKLFIKYSISKFFYPNFLKKEDNKEFYLNERESDNAIIISLINIVILFFCIFIIPPSLLSFEILIKVVSNFFIFRLIVLAGFLILINSWIINKMLELKIKHRTYPFYSYFNDIEDPENFYLKENEKGGLSIIKPLSRPSKKLILPRAHKGKKINIIEEKAFDKTKLDYDLTEMTYCNNPVNLKINSIHIPNSITEIKERAFGNCEVEEINIPKSLKKIPKDLLGENKEVKKITLNSRKVIEELKKRNKKKDAKKDSQHPLKKYFGNKVKELIIEEGIKQIDAGFRMEGALEKLTVYGVREIKELAFSENKIKDFTITSNIKRIRKNAFMGLDTNEKLETITITINSKKFLKGISGNKFYNIFGGYNPKKIIIGKNIKTIPGYSFYIHKDYKSNTRNTTKLEIRGDVVKIGDGAFANNSIEEVEFPNGLKEIGISAFANNSIKEVYLPKSIKKIKQQAFKNNDINLTVYLPKEAPSKEEIFEEYSFSIKEELNYKIERLS